MSTSAQRYIFAGGPGAGKSTVLQLLSDRGYLCVPDHARATIQSRNEQGLSPRPEPVEFANEILRRDVAAFERVRLHDGSVFFERAIPDALCMLHDLGALDRRTVSDYAARYPYNRRAFFFAPWPEIYVQDAERDHPWDHAVRVGGIVASWYRANGFDLLEVPRAAPVDRVAFVLDHLSTEATY